MTATNDSAVDADHAEALADLATVAERFAKPDVARVRELRGSGRSFDPAVWRRFAEMGWLGLSVPESLGGSGGSEAAVAVVAEKLGAGAYPEPYVAASVLTTALLTSLASEGDAARDLLDRVVSGTEVVALAARIVEGGPRPDGVRGVTADMSSSEVKLNGRLDWVQVPEADVFVVQARTDHGSVLVRVPGDAGGLMVHRRGLADRTSVAALEFDNVVVQAGAVLGAGEAADTAIAEATEAALLGTAAELVGIADRALSITLEYLKTREQFGKPIGSFQALQHRAVDMYIHLRVARAALRSALAVRSRAESTPGHRRAVSSGAYARACIVAGLICRHSVHLHGAIGFTDEYDLGHYVNRMLVLTAWLGGADRHRRQYAELTGALAAGQQKDGQEW
jgi:alkylation response protein AidB-like acyl-CoA dehydrogenase